MKKANFYNQLENSLVQCQLCSHFCLIKPGEVGRCRARKNYKGELNSLVYGYPVALNVDPIEKKPLFHFLPGSFSYSLGTYGCNFKCANCQNWDISQAERIEKKTKNLEFISPEKIVRQALENECQSISYTYNEPTIFTEYALEIMKLAQTKNLKNVWVSNGFMSPKCLEAIVPYLDAINVDLKSMDENFYKNNCSAVLAPVLKNLESIKSHGVHLEITTLIIPKLSDDLTMLKKVAQFIGGLGSDTPWHISRFSPEISWQLHSLPKTTEEIMIETYNAGKEAGLKYVYLGNIPGDQRENTYCPKCGELAIRRFGFEVERLDKHGRCPKCDTDLDIN